VTCLECFQVNLVKSQLKPDRSLFAAVCRYQLLTYIYSGIYLAHSKGGTLARALLFTDPSDKGAR
jgi:alpha-glucosidase (family GH31 glycosyl hydrolase)